jgi:hypothetical protein
VLLTNGCSFVWGDELRGFDTEPPSHQEHTFTHKLANLLGMPYVNLSTCGGGNDKIFRDTIVYLSDPTKPKPSHMVILWSGWSRLEFAEARPEVNNWGQPLPIQRFDDITQISPERVRNLMPQKWGPVFKYFDEAYDTRTVIIQHLSKMVAMQTLCDAMGIKLVQGAFHIQLKESLRHIINDNHKLKRYGNWQKKVDHMMGLLRKESKIGLTSWIDMYSLAEQKYTLKPNSHPDEDTHTEYAGLLYHIFNQS